MSSRIAVLMTCFNRIELSIRCLDSLFEISNSFEVYLVDDASTDGTAKLIKDRFPQVNIIAGNGQLFWNRGMHRAWMEALKSDYDFYLWLNNDVELYQNALEELLECSKSMSNEAIISGIIEDKSTKESLYGGYDKNKRIIAANGELQSIVNLNGNSVLVPASVVNKIGILDPKFHHDLGDVDYGLRAQKQGIAVLCTRIPIGSGTKNSIMRVRSKNTNISNRFRNVYSPLGSNPFITFYFRRKHIGILNAISYFIFIHILNALPDYLVTLIFRNRY